MAARIEKRSRAFISYADRSAERRHSATYAVYCSGTPWAFQAKANIFNEGDGSSGRSYMASSSWVVEFTERSEAGKIRRSYHPTFRAAKTWAVTHVC